MASPARAPAHVAVVNPEAAVRPEFEELRRAGLSVSVLRSAAQIPALVQQRRVDALILPLGPDGAAIAPTIAALRRSNPRAFVIAVVNGAQDEALAHRLPADDVLAGPLNALQLRLALSRGFLKARTAAKGAPAVRPPSRSSLGALIGASEPMQRLYDAILRVAGTNTTVVIRGESGTGKELVARAIVQLGPRRAKPFVRLNCAALPEALIESELFGHERGAFTGAVAPRPGHIEMANGGTLFLDEIATLPLALQSKLLRVLEERAVQRLGGNTWKTIDFRLLTATNEPLEELVKANRFREDLYYRIHVVPILVPPLRERRADIALLADHFLRVYCAANSLPVKRLDLDVLEVLEESPWPGNIRELENLIQRLVLMVEDKNIRVQHLPEQMLYASASHHESMLIPDEGIDFDKEMERIESAYVQAALRRAGGKKAVAAALLRVNAQRMKYLCRKHRIDKG